MRAMLARVRGSLLPPVQVVIADHQQEPDYDDPRPYGDAIVEAFDQCKRLGMDLEPNPEPDYDASSLIRHSYAAGWLACESRITCPDMADLIDQAINNPGEVIEQHSGESLNQWTIRAVQQAVAYGVKSEPH